MDKHCEGCKYRFIDYQKNPNWSFCTYEKLLEQTFIDDTFDDCISHAANTLNKLKDDKNNCHLPSCMLVQTYYDGKCPYLTKDIGVLQYNEKFAITKTNPIANNIYIETDKITLHHKELDIEFDLDNGRLKEIESIKINGIKFMREK